MAKRFTDTEKWKDDWYLSLSNDNRVVWQYLLDQCSIAGVLKKNFKMLNFCCSTDLSEADFLETFKYRVMDMGSFYFIPKFLKYQYGNGLNSNKPMVLSIKNELLAFGVYEIVTELFGNDYLIIKDKDKVKDKDKELKGSLQHTKNDTLKKVAEWKRQWEKENRAA